MKVLYVATVASHICQFHLPYLETFQKSGAEVHVAAKNNLAEKNGLQLKFVDKYFDIPFSRSPIAKSNISAYKQLKKVILENNYDYIVCNTPTGGILTRLAARKARKSGSKVIYIAHGFHFYKGAPLKNWLIFYPIEYLFAPLCDILVTINKEDYLYATKHFKTTVRHIHGIGVSTDKYHPVCEQEIAQLRKNLNLQSNDYVILCTGELNKNKNQTQLINAASLLKDKISNLKILLAGNGPNEQSLRTQIKELELQNIVTLLGYRTDLEKIVPAVNLIVSCSRREGLPLNIVEAMLCQKPIVATYNRGHNELIKEGENGFLVSPNSINDMSERIYTIYNDVKFAKKLALKSSEIAQNYTVNAVKNNFFNFITEN